MPAFKLGINQKALPAGPLRRSFSEASRQGFAPIILLVGVLVITLVVGGVYYYSQSKQKLPIYSPSNPANNTVQPTPSPTPDPTANWEIYANEKYGFSLKYPGGLNLESSDESGYGYIKIGNYITISISEDSYSMDCLNYQLGKSRLPPDHCSINDESTYEWIKVDGFEAVKIKGVSGGFAPPADYLLVIIKKGNYYYHLRVGEPVKEETLPLDITPIPIPEKEQQIFSQILSTFKFLDQTTESCLPRPACLDATPRCLMPEPAGGWCK